MARFVRFSTLFLATGAGVGWSPWMPGTLGSLVGILLYLGWMGLSPTATGAALAALFFLSVWVSGRAEVDFAVKDSPKIVIDEVFGMLITLSLLPLSWKTVLAGFLFFRIFDIWKPFPVRCFQDRFPSGWGIVLDDAMAGIYANLVLRIVLHF